MSWKDESSYSRDDKDRTPNTFATRFGPIRALVHRHKDYPPDAWLFSAEPFFHQFRLDETDAEKALREATKRMGLALKDALQDVNHQLKNTRFKA